MFVRARVCVRVGVGAVAGCVGAVVSFGLVVFPGLGVTRVTTRTLGPRASVVGLSMKLSALLARAVRGMVFGCPVC